MIPLLEIRSLTKYYSVRTSLFGHRWARVLDGVDLTLNPGETLGIVGESGCGKTTLARCILRIVPPTSGQILFEGDDLSKMSRATLRTKRREMGIVYQNPYLSLSPRLRLRDLVAEPLTTHTSLRGQALTGRVLELLQAVGLSPEHLRRRAHELSGGQAQRVAIARALALNPKLVVLDEPTSALDVSVQAQILNLLISLQRERHLTYLFISHNLDVMQHVADRIAVMYLGQIMELGPTEAIFAAPKHPYTRALLASTPASNPAQRLSTLVLEGNVPSPLAPPPGCRFHPRCPWAQARCHEEASFLRLVDKERLAACHFVETIEASAPRACR